MSPHPALEIDLHGCTVESATRRLLQELTRARALRMSPVLIVTGRGMGSLGGTSRLGPAVKGWLKGPEGARLGVGSIQNTAGGGALLITLQRPSERD